MIEDTIAAIATAVGEGSIAVIRISGPEAISIADRVYHGKAKLDSQPTHTIHYGKVKDPGTGETVDEVLVSIMRAPRSFTMEDVVEVSCHGGIVPVRRTLDLLLEAGARLAEPGEFTKRAFLNGRIDLAQAEAVMDLIRSRSDRAFSVAMKQSEGSLSERIRSLRHDLVELMAHIEVNIDYPEHDVEEMTNSFIIDKTESAIAAIDGLLRTARQGKVLREGIVTAIVGRPNVGKSSLMNELAQEERAIVTDIPGTTRDVIEEYVTVNGIPLKLLDTAGIRETADVVERIGVERSKSAIADADLILMVVNRNEALSDDEKSLIEQLRGKAMLLLLNKSDLPSALDMEWLSEHVDKERMIEMSVKEHRGIDQLGEAIAKMFFSGAVETADPTYVSNSRHIHLLNQANHSLQEALRAAEEWMPIDMIQIDIRTAWEKLGEIIGDAVGESLLDQIFSQFCLGK
ncbi:tRNA uridine-5-carboxymethylaminomethyl(34) synthesis GTPase MnmE [Xylanibacillus composti]|uniref:tRNA modification GTPase MnmE n=1 Tax=Xylanibacillus composti TaxID=1572762 RepID=A0A8J4H7L8_9BACL|nr:tRNA uridine-5-carboxymethylaminomethyl(34) synthesis GTPase MnmE [Xylanibacillus composti]MDT9725188.1 tRNA uridine-5-carboxymethylaminomethyl(34) synthesis GTPase MnmE [Xylanibacillus composti]GIQ70038.1 tRNA modification GTPase MnmE [Xylanibacillus composti]